MLLEGTSKKLDNDLKKTSPKIPSSKAKAIKMPFQTTARGRALPELGPPMPYPTPPDPGGVRPGRDIKPGRASRPRPHGTKPRTPERSSHGHFKTNEGWEFYCEEWEKGDDEELEPHD